MVEKSPVMVLSEVEEVGVCGGGDESVRFDLDVSGQRVGFRIDVLQERARLSDIVVVAREISTKLVLLKLESLRREGRAVPCCKGCHACCNYLVPLSIPEVFRMRREIMELPVEQSDAVLRWCIDAASKILEARLAGFDWSESAQGQERVDIDQVADWYGGLDLTCPLLSDGICMMYSQRPTACREHIVTGSASACEAGSPEKPHVVPTAASIVQVLGGLAAELEDSDVEAVMLPLALPWAQENLERSQRQWSAVYMVERFVEILKAAVEAGALHTHDADTQFSKQRATSCGSDGF